MKRLIVSCFFALSALLSTQSSAAPQCVAQPGNYGAGIGSGLWAGGAAKISATFCGGSAGYINSVYFFGNDSSWKHIGTGNLPSGAIVNLNAVKQGDELIFKIDVDERNGTFHTYYTGQASRNGDNFPHASVMQLGNGSSWIGFEDIWGGGDRDYNDAQFVVEVATVGVICDCNANWNNHGEYVSCVAHAVNEFVNLGVLRPNEKGPIISEAGRSQCGK